MDSGEAFGASFPSAENKTAAVMQVDRRFAFGKNWERFLAGLDDDRIRAAEQSLSEKLGDLHGKSFLDIGSGSGLFSLTARRLGARVHSFDFDPDCVRCTEELKSRYFGSDREWAVERGDILDTGYLKRFKPFDIVYSWGVLHHTGDMSRALENAASLVKPGGLLMVAIYNDQGNVSHRWLQAKRLYNRTNSRIVRGLLTLGTATVFDVPPIWSRLIRFKNPFPPEGWSRKERGMSYWVSIIDWIGGYPFEFAKPDQIFSFYSERGFILRHLKTIGGGSGCNEYVFQRCVGESDWPPSERESQPKFGRIADRTD